MAQEEVSFQPQSEDTLKKSEVPNSIVYQPVPNAESILPFMYSMLLPTYVPLQNEEQADHGPGIYAVPVNPYIGACVGLPSNGLIPLRYNIPTSITPLGAAGGEQDQQGREQQGAQRPVVVRRFQIAIHLDLFLILKLMIVVIIFNQDGSRQRFLTLLLFAAVVYLHQTGAFAPLIRWLRRQTAPRPGHEPHRPPLRPGNVLVGQEDANAPRHEGTPVTENQNQPGENGDRPVENENLAEEAQRGNWWGIAREIQMFVVGFISSLLPGFHQHND